MIESFGKSMIVADNQDFAIWLTVAALISMTTLASWAVIAIRKLTKNIDCKVSSLDDLYLVGKVINLDMMLVWPVLSVVATYMLTMIVLKANDYISVDALLNSFILYSFGTICLGIFGKVNEKKLQTLDTENTELANVYEAMLKDWKRRWFRLLPMSSYTFKPKQTEKTVKTIINYTEM